MKKQILLLASMLLPLVSSCNSIPTMEPTAQPTFESTLEPTVEPSEEIYYLDGLASNLFVTEVPENVEVYYSEYYNSYIAKCYTNKAGVVYENIDCIIPNVYDDGIHGLQVIKKFAFKSETVGYINKLILSEGIEESFSYIGDIAAIEIYFPSTIKEMNSLWKDVGTHNSVGSKRRYYNGTVEQFKKIEVEPPIYCVDKPFKVDFICLDGVAYFDFYDALYGC